MKMFHSLVNENDSEKLKKRIREMAGINESIKELNEARSIGAVKIRKLKELVAKHFDEHLSIDDFMDKYIPNEWFHTWEGAYDEIKRIIYDTRLNLTHKKVNEAKLTKNFAYEVMENGEEIDKNPIDYNPKTKESEHNGGQEAIYEYKGKKYLITLDWEDNPYKIKKWANDSIEEAKKDWTKEKCPVCRKLLKKGRDGKWNCPKKCLVSITEAKNEFAKERKPDNPYEIWKSHDGTWEWRVLKKWQIDDNKPYARWFCAVKSPFTYGDYDLGDVYVKEIKEQAHKVWEEKSGKPIPKK